MCCILLSSPDEKSFDLENVSQAPIFGPNLRRRHVSALKNASTSRDLLPFTGRQLLDVQFVKSATQISAQL